MESEKAEADAVVPKNHAGGSSKPEFQINNSSRLQRNQAEKQRRDRLNGYVTELATLVPMVKNATKPLDKVSILRLTAAHMRLNLSCLNPKQFKGDVPHLPSSFVSHLETIEKSLAGFIVVTTFAGQVVFCSRSIENFVGFHDIDVIGQPIFNYVHEKEVSFFKRKVSSIVSQYQKKCTKDISKVIKMHLKQRPLPRTNETKYLKMKFKLSIHCNESPPTKQKDINVNVKKKRTGYKDFGSSAVILMFIQPSIESSISFLLESHDVYYTIHGLKGEIMFADQRISTVTGYLAHEVKGTSAYHYICESDVPIALFAQKAMFSSDDGIGLITYRLKIFGSDFIYLQSKGRIIYKDSSTEMSHFVCYNRCLSEEEGSKELRKFQDRFAPQVEKVETEEGKEIVGSAKSSLSSIIPSHDSIPNNSSLSHSPPLSNSVYSNTATEVSMEGYSTTSPNENLIYSPKLPNGLYSDSKGRIEAARNSYESDVFDFPKEVMPIEFENNDGITMMDIQETDFELSDALFNCVNTLYNMNKVSPDVYGENRDMFPQHSVPPSNSSLSNDIIMRNSSSSSTFNSTSPEKENSPNMRLVNPGVKKDTLFYNAVPVIPDGNQNLQRLGGRQIQLLNNFKTVTTSSTFSGDQSKLQPFDEALIADSNKFSGASDKTFFKNVCSTNNFLLSDQEAVQYNESAGYPHFDRGSNDKTATSTSELDASILHIPPNSQNIAYSKQQTNFSVGKNCQNYSCEMNPLDVFTNGNGSTFKLSRESQGSIAMSPVFQNRNITPGLLSTKSTETMNEQLLLTYPSKRKKMANDGNFYDEHQNAPNDANLVQKLYESQLNMGNTFDGLLNEQPLESDARLLNQCQTELSFENCSFHKDTDDVNMNGELFNELDAYFAKLPSSVCSQKPSDIPHHQNWNLTGHEISPISFSEPIINGGNQMDFTLLR